MNLGVLYKIKRFHWLLFNSAENAMWSGDTRWHCADNLELARGAAYIIKSNKKIEVSCVSTETIIVFIEAYGETIKVLTADGKIGWFYIPEEQKDHFEEIK